MEFSGLANVAITGVTAAAVLKYRPLRVVPVIGSNEWGEAALNIVGGYAVYHFAPDGLKSVGAGLMVAGLVEAVGSVLP